MDHKPSQHNDAPPRFWRSRYAVGLLVMGSVAAYFLLSEHRALIKQWRSGRHPRDSPTSGGYRALHGRDRLRSAVSLSFAT